MTTSFSKLLIHHLHKVFFCLCFYILIFLHVGAAVVVNDLQSQFLGLDYRSSNVILNRKILWVKELKKKSQSTPILTDDSYFDFDLCCFWFEVLRKQPNVTVCVGRLLMVSCCQECRLPYAQIAHSHRNTSCCVSGLKPVNTHLFHPSAQKHVEQAIEQRALISTNSMRSLTCTNNITARVSTCITSICSNLEKCLLLYNNTSLGVT